MIELLQVETSHGPARARLERPAGTARGLLAMSHGAGGGIDAADLVAVAGRAVDRGFVVALVEQPYRVAGRRAPAPAKQLDTCWREVIAVLRKELGDDVPLVVGGRSMGARVACRTAGDVGADAVLCLAFPLQPRPRKGRVVPDRLHELDAVEVPVLVV
ncbi:MAG: alpha/beta hydrolase, partial [Thermoleophilia bacterium]|nr:alpha/beta hydrolase [Thermoleophilia bacterium]